MKKDIYIIKNLINDKVYIGQSLDAEHRFYTHCKPSSCQRDGLLIDKAIQKYGADNFYYEVIEEQVENYNERERFWIAFYNCKAPFGYNLSDGGDEPPVHYGIDHPNSRFDSIQEVDDIKRKLRETSDSLLDIAQEFNVSKRTVLRINQGLVYATLDEDYPLRKVPNNSFKLSDQDVADIIEILQYSYRQYESIAKQYGISITMVKEINAGRLRHQENIKYPIRNYKNSGKVMATYEQVSEIINLLIYTNISFNKISKQYNIPLNTLYGINSGAFKRYKRDGYTYPLRSYN